MKFLTVVLFLSTTLLSFAQETIEPIRAANRKSFSNVLKSTTSIDSTFIYSFDTLALPLFDDFSSSKFQQKNAQPGDPNVTEQVFFRLTDLSNAPLASQVVYTSAATKIFTTQNGATVETTLPALQIKVGDFSAYPVQYTTVNAYPPYYIYDTLDFVNDPDTVYITTPEYTQATARLFFAQVGNPQAIWVDDFAYHNYTHAFNPWSLGVVTFDGLDENGYPYSFGSTTSGSADVLTSKTIDLSSYIPNDSIYLSFLVQPKGLGDEPEASDSIVLEFYNQALDTWNLMWKLNGSPLSDFKIGHVKITQAAYLTAGFKFRFRNIGGLSGMLDEFHLDYVHIRTGSGYQDTLFKDFAFVYPINTLLEDYTQVPWDHWVNSPIHMTDSAMITVRNGSNIAENNLNGTVAIKHAGVVEGSFNLIGQTLSGGQANYAPRTVYTSFHDFKSGYAYSVTPGLEEKSFEIIGAASSQFPNFAKNDSTFSTQYFGNEYAYDDGSAEAAYGITGSQARLAYRFVPYEADTLLGVKIHFVPTVNDVSDKLFLLTVWSDNNGQPGTVLYQDEFFFPRTPMYENDRGVFTDYYLNDTALSLLNAPFYVGYRQIDEDRLNVGFDRNTDNSNNTFYSLNGGASWQTSSIPGSMMMRPIFSTNGNADLGINTHSELNWSVYPNPTASYLSINWQENTPFPGGQITDINGRILLEMETNQSTVDMTHLPVGMYFFQLNGHAGAIKKITKY